MDQEQVKEYLESDDGKELLEALKQPLVSKNTELLGTIKTFKADLEILKQKETDREAAIEAANTTATKAKLDSENDVTAYKQFHEEEIAKKDDAINALKSNFAQSELTRTVQATASKYSGTPKPLELLLRDRVTSSYGENGELLINVLDKEGKAMMHNGVKAGITDLVEELKAAEENAAFFSGTGSSGSGTQITDKSTTVGKPAMGEPGYNLTDVMAAQK